MEQTLKVPRQSHMIADSTLLLVRTDAGLLSLYKLEYEAKHPGESFKKALSAILDICKRQAEYLCEGKRTMRLDWWLRLQEATGITLYSRIVYLHTIHGGNNGSLLHKL